MVKSFIHVPPDVTPWMECPGLRVYVPDAAYIFAMKAVAGRSEDLRDLEVLRGVLQLDSVDAALQILERYISRPALTPRVQYLIEDLFDHAEP